MSAGALFAALIIGLGGMKLTELYKETCRRLGYHNQSAWWKTVVSLVICQLLALLITNPWREKVLVGLGAAGIAALLHAVDTYLRTCRDDMASQVLARRTPRR